MADTLSLTVMNNIVKKINRSGSGTVSGSGERVKHLSDRECNLLSSVLHKTDVPKRNNVNQDAVSLESFIESKTESSKNISLAEESQKTESSYVHRNKSSHLTLEDLATRCRQSS